MEMFTQGQMDAFAVENVETERKRIHGILSRILGAIQYAEAPLSRYEIDEILDKVILGNRK